MAAEVECYRFKGKKDKLEEAYTVKPGSLEATEFFGSRVGMVVSCDIDNSSSTVMIPGKPRNYKNIEAIVYRDEEDRDGDEVDLREGRVTLIKPQELSLVFFKKRRRKPQRQIYIYFSSSEDNVIEDLPEESRPLSVV